MAYTVPPLPYPYDALEPYIDKMTMEVHHDKHHQAYVDNANAALEGTSMADAPGGGPREPLAAPGRRSARRRVTTWAATTTTRSSG